MTGWEADNSRWLRVLFVPSQCRKQHWKQQSLVSDCSKPQSPFQMLMRSHKSLELCSTAQPWRKGAGLLRNGQSPALFELGSSKSQYVFQALKDFRSLWRLQERIKDTPDCLQQSKSQSKQKGIESRTDGGATFEDEGLPSSGMGSKESQFSEFQFTVINLLKFTNSVNLPKFCFF